MLGMVEDFASGAGLDYAAVFEDDDFVAERGDDAEDAAVIAGLAPHTRFARVWHDLHRVAR